MMTDQDSDRLTGGNGIQFPKLELGAGIKQKQHLFPFQIEFLFIYLFIYIYLYVRERRRDGGGVQCMLRYIFRDQMTICGT